MSTVWLDKRQPSVIRQSSWREGEWSLRYGHLIAGNPVKKKHSSDIRNAYVCGTTWEDYEMQKIGRIEACFCVPARKTELQAVVVFGYHGHLHASIAVEAAWSSPLQTLSLGGDGSVVCSLTSQTAADAEALSPLAVGASAVPGPTELLLPCLASRSWANCA